MGIIIRQAAYSSVFSYVGVLIGFLNITILMNRWLTPDELGLREVLLNIAMILSQLGSLGAISSMVKFYPFFRVDNKTDKGLLGIGFVITLIGFLFFSGLLMILKPYLLTNYADESAYLTDFFWLLFPLSFLLLNNQVLEGYIRAKSQISVPTFIKEVLHRLIVLLLLVIYRFEVIDFTAFMLLFVCSYAVNSVLYFFYLLLNNELDLSVDRFFFRKRFRKVFLNYGFFSILSGFSNLLIAKVDIIMIGFAIGFSASAIYANAVYLTVLIFIPGIAISKIASPIIAKSLKENDFEEIDMIYKKSSTNQFLIGGVIFLLLWINIDAFFEFQRPVYKEGKYVLCVLGLSRVLTMFFGVSGPILSLSKYYRLDTITSISLAILTVLTNYIMIPVYGIEGAAYATMFSLTAFYSVRFVLIKKHLNIQPFSKQTIILVVVFITAYLAVSLVPFLINIYVDSIVRSILILLIISFLVIKLNVSEDVSRLFQLVRNRISFRVK